MKVWGKHIERYKGIITSILVTISVYLSFKFLLPLFLPFLVAYLIAWMIRPISDYLYLKFKLPRIVGGIILILTLVSILGIGFYYLCATLLKQGISFIKNLPIYLNIITGQIDRWSTSCETLLGLSKGSVTSVINENINEILHGVRSSMLPSLSNTLSVTISAVTFFGVVIIMIIATILIVKEMPELNKKYGKKQIYQDIHNVTDQLIDAGIGYFRSQFIVMVIVAFFCVVGLTLLENDYAFLLGIGIAIMDALPILGSGMILLPWSIVMLLSGNIFGAAVLITIYLLSLVTREVLEPKIIGNRIGIKPLYTLIAMYIGLKLFSIVGFILGPLGLILIVNIVKIINGKSSKSSSIVLANGDEKSGNES